MIAVTPRNGERPGTSVPGLPDRIATTTLQDQRTAPDQGDILAYAAQIATSARDSGSRAALQNANADPDTERVRQELDDLITSGEQFSTDDLSHPAGRGVMGALILQASNAGRIVSVGRIRSKRIQAHGRWIDVWVGMQR